jgi:hypothetical protein
VKPTFPTTRPLWQLFKKKAKTAQSIGLLRSQAVMGYSGVDETSREIEKAVQNEQRRQLRFVIMPDSQFRSFWDLLQMIFLVYIAITSPIRYRLGR